MWHCKYQWAILNKQGWGLLNNFPHSLIFQNHQNSAHLLSITFIFDRCHRSSAAVTPVKYECDWGDLRSTFAKSILSLTEKLMDAALVIHVVTPTLEPLSTSILHWSFCTTLQLSIHCGAIITKKTHNKHPEAYLWGWTIWVSIMTWNSDLYSASVTVMLYATSCYIGPWYNRG